MLSRVDEAAQDRRGGVLGGMLGGIQSTRVQGRARGRKATSEGASVSSGGSVQALILFRRQR